MMRLLVVLLLSLMLRASTVQAFALRAFEPVALRQLVIDAVWSGGGLPLAGAEIEQDVADPLGLVPNLARVDRLAIEMGGGFTARPVVFHPLFDANRLALVHQGHSGYTLERYGLGDVVRALVADGYTVIGFLMPGDPPNTRMHNGYPEPTAELNYLRYFMEPVVRALNTYQARRWDAVVMTGVSGGGWATTLAAAIDTRIEASVPVAGSLPIAARQTQGDWEQRLPGLYPALDYGELHLLAVTGGRRQTQLLNRYDACCSNYAMYSAILPYGDVVAAASEGRWQLAWDETHREHRVSPWGRAVILETFSK